MKFLLSFCLEVMRSLYTPMKIIIVEHDEKFAQTLRSGLELEGHAVDIASDATQGEHMLLRPNDDYTIAIIDLMLPEKSALALCKTARAHGVYLPILILAERGDIEDKQTALASGGSDYLPRPFSFSQLLARIHALRPEPNATPPTMLNVHDLTLDPETRVVKRGGKTLDLTQKEFRILHYLMRHEHRVMRREEIFAYLWDLSDTAPSNVIDTHIKNLRKKIDKGYSVKLLETIHGVGYVLKG